MNLETSSVWVKIKTQLKQDRNDLVEQLIQPTTLQNTDILRGKIQQIDDILDGYQYRLANNKESDTQ